MIPDLRDTILNTWRTNNRVTLFLVERIPPELWASAIPGAPRRTIQMMAAHIHNVRHVLAYFVAHEAHHRGQLVLLARRGRRGGGPRAGIPSARRSHGWSLAVDEAGGRGRGRAEATPVRLIRIVRAACLLAIWACGRSATRQPGADAESLYLWTGSADSMSPDFLAVLDVTEDAARYGRLVATVPVPGLRNMPHHTEHQLSPDHRLFANGFATGQTFVFDLGDAGKKVSDGWMFFTSATRLTRASRLSSATSTASLTRTRSCDSPAVTCSPPSRCGTRAAA